MLLSSDTHSHTPTAQLLTLLSLASLSTKTGNKGKLLAYLANLSDEQVKFDPVINLHKDNNPPFVELRLHTAEIF